MTLLEPMLATAGKPTGTLGFSPTASATASNPTPKVADRPISAALEATGDIMVNEAARQFSGRHAAGRSRLWTRKRPSFAADGMSEKCHKQTPLTSEALA
jgi:hypothetical protein